MNVECNGSFVFGSAHDTAAVLKYVYRFKAVRYRVYPMKKGMRLSTAYDKRPMRARRLTQGDD